MSVQYAWLLRAASLGPSSSRSISHNAGAQNLGVSARAQDVSTQGSGSGDINDSLPVHAISSVSSLEESLLVDKSPS